MHIECTKENKTLTAALRGELDHHSANKVRETLDMLIQSEQIDELILEMSGVTFMDSTGIGVILGRFKLLSEKGGIVKIANAHGHAESILKMSGVFSIMDNIKINTYK